MRFRTKILASSTLDCAFIASPAFALDGLIANGQFATGPFKVATFTFKFS
jgi:hypothetical protein